MDQDTGSLNARWAGSIMEELVRCGVETVVFSSGFRNAPLVVAADAHSNLDCISHFDERGAAFFALGCGRHDRKPAVWITTSGTALANGYPAVVEAAMDHVPLLCLTADRPAELRDTGANQVIDQHGIFGRYPRWFVDMPPPGSAMDPAYVLSTINQACYHASDGPVHINCQFREPLVGGDASMDHIAHSSRADASPFTRYFAPVKQPPALGELVDRLKRTKRGLVVAGRLASKEEGAAVTRVATELGWPLLPDITSQAITTGDSASLCVANFELCLKSSAFSDRSRPEAVLQIGGPCVSKPLLEFLVASELATWIVVNRSPLRIDPAHRVSHKFEADVIPFCKRLVETSITSTSDQKWLSTWTAAARRVEEILARVLDEPELGLSEPYIARALTRLIPGRSILVAGNSMPIRDLSMFRSSFQADDIFVAANRGASGIDGTVATAAGLAESSGKLVTLLIGDLALLHDINSLALTKRRPLIIVVLNNDGGGIFNLLPIPKAASTIERCFGTPHGLDFEHAAGMFGLDYVRPESRRAFETAYMQALRERRPALIEITTERKRNALHHKELYDLVRQGLENES